MKDPTPETAPLMHAAANESIAAMFAQGCALEVKCGDLNFVLKRFLDELPSRRDWLDPDLERIAKDLVR